MGAREAPEGGSRLVTFSTHQRVSGPKVRAVKCRAPSSSACPCMTLPADVTVLSGERLSAFLDDLDGPFESDSGSDNSSSLETLKRTLAGVRLMPDSALAFTRCIRVHLYAEDAEGALRLLDDEALLARIEVPPAERRMHRFDRQFARAAAHRIGGDTAVQLRALSAAEAVLNETAPAPPPQDAWFHLANQYGQAGDRAGERRALAAAHAQTSAQPERVTLRAWDAALLATHLAGSLKQEGRVEEAQAAVDDAIAALGQTRGAILENQQVDVADWLSLADRWVDIAPDSIARIAQYVRGLTPQDLPLAQRRAVEIRTARLEARAAAGRGCLGEAIERSAAGRLAIEVSEPDDFSATVLGWLMSSGRVAEAARLAYESEYGEREASSQAACVLAAEQAAAAPGAHALWHLTLAHGAQRGVALTGRGSEPANTYVERQFAMARGAGDATEPHVAARLDAFEGQRLVDRGRDLESALALLERAAVDPDVTDRGNLERLWLCRVKLHGPKAGLAMPYVETHSAGWAYNLGVILSSHLQESAGISDADWPEAAAEALAERYYQRGLQLFEACFETGKGRYRDADAHVYSMLCNNLAIRLRHRGEWLDAAALHAAGIEASPFAEHYDGFMRCLYKEGENHVFVQAAEGLWHFAADHGYSRHDPASYIHNVAGALHELGRDSEIAIWLERLESWWAEQDADMQAEDRDDYLSALLTTLVHQSHTQPEDAVQRLEPSIDALRSVPRDGTLRLVGRVYYQAGKPEQALAFYEEELAMFAQGRFSDPDQRRFLDADLKRCHAAIKARNPRPWWKVWA